MRKSQYDPEPVFISYLKNRTKSERDDSLVRVIGQQAMSFRKDYGWTRKTVAESFGVSENTIQRFEMGLYFNIYVMSAYLAKMVEYNETGYLNEQLNMVK